MFMWINEAVVETVADVVHALLVVVFAAKNIIGCVKCTIQRMFALMLEIRIALHII